MIHRTRTAGFGDALRPLLVLLALGLALRLIIAYVLLPGSGFGVDIASFQYWAGELARNGPFGFYRRGFFIDYTPGYLYVLWLLGLVGQAFGGGVGELIKLPSILGDAALGALVYLMVQDLGGSRRAALVGAALVIVNPVTWFDSAIWGQVDSVGTVVLLLSLRELWRDRPERATLLTTVAAVIKPQLGIMVPIAVAVLLRRYLFPPQGRPRQPLRLVTSGVVGLATASLLSLPFGLSFIDLLGQVVHAAAGYPYLTVNAYNPWALLSLAGRGLAATGSWVADAPGTGSDGLPLVPFTFGPVPAVAVGTALLLLVIVAVAIAVFRRADDRRAVLVGLTVLAIAFFVVPTRVHERYLFPFFALGAILAATSLRWRWAYVALAAASFANLYAILTLPFYKNPDISDWLGLGDALRSFQGVAVVALVHLAIFLWALVQLRAGGLRALEAEAAAEAAAGGAAAEAAALERGPAAGPTARSPWSAPRDPLVRPAGTPAGLSLAPASPVPMAIPAGLAAAGRATGLAAPVGEGAAMGDGSADEPWGGGAWDWFRRRLTARPIRADRSRSLDREPRGHIDRLDLWFFAVIVIGTLVLRIWRLPEPYSMHFDEVYHARTATEFLQDWRYGEPHSIYEWTHPHLAKYAMAVGLVVFGNDRVTATSSLGVPVRDAVIEPQADDPLLPGGTSGDRLYVATGSEVRAYDLATRALVADFRIPGATALGLDATDGRLYVGTAAGEVLSIDTAGLDRRSADPSAALPLPARLAGLGGAVRRLYAADGGGYLVALLPGDRVVSLDTSSGAQLASVSIPGAADFAAAGSSQALFAAPDQVPDKAAAATLLAQLLGGDAATYAQQLQSTHDVAIHASMTDLTQANVQAAIADGRLAGFSFRTLPEIAVAEQTGVSMLDPSSGAIVDHVRLDSPATGIAAVSGLDAPYLYVAAGRQVAVIKLSTDPSQGTASLYGTVPMPAEVQRVTFDPASVMVHVLGTAPGGHGSTVYVIEPHGNAVYEDAPLPFAPSAWAMDANQQYPAGDREQLLTFAADGRSAGVDVGSHAFAWRLPGVIAGSLMAGLLYLLARLLFRRRSVGILVGIFTFIDGMLFVQARIGMNDTYVGLFIVAAYFLFAALWTGAWRGKWAFWIAMPLIGTSLGLGLASKWVALYAIGGIGMLILARSALGRVLFVAGLLVGTVFLGYIAIAEVPAGLTGGANLSFLLLMVGLTLAGTLVLVLHPLRWTVEEVRFAVGTPVVLGGLILLVAVPLGLGSGQMRAALEAAFAVAALGVIAALALWAAGRWGFGPLAPPPAPDDPALLAEPPAPAAEGWLRPGWLGGIPVAWMLICLLLLPAAIYVISYLPWVALGNRLTDNWPPGNTGQTFLALQQQMYDYHNNLRVGHPASSPWWAWPFDLKPVWFYQGSFAASTAASIYDGGNLVLWWLAIPATAFVAWQAYKRRSLGLSLVLIAFLTQWLGWARIDRATFEYHWYAALPFFLLGLAYFLAELWHGPSPRTWLLARIAAAVAILGPSLLWLLKSPLCTFVRVDIANPGSLACSATAGDLVVTQRVAAIVVIMVLAVVSLLIQLVRLESPGREQSGEAGRRLVAMGGTAVAAAVSLVVAGAIFGDGVLLDVNGLRAEALALALAVPLLFLAGVVVTARDPRRFTVGVVLAGVLEFVVFYPNISALPLPSVLVNAYQGLLPTWLYPFQFPVDLEPSVTVKLLSAGPAILFVSLTAAVLVVGYAASVWRTALAERRALAAAGASDDRSAIVEG